MQSHKHPINQWAKDDRPREKLLSKNPQSLSDCELLAILIRTGSLESSALELARKVFELSRNNLQELGKLSVQQLKAVKGIGNAKAISIVAAVELGRRRQASLSPDRPQVRNSREIVTFLQATLQDYHQEVFAVAYLNNAGKMLHFGIISQGSITSTIVDPRLILKRALEEDAVSIIICHNHPSGSLQPSRADKELTQKIKEGAALLDIRLLDHVIVSEEGHFSFADSGLL